MRVILDTNILLSAMMVRGSPPDRIYRAWSARHFDLVCCEQIFAEIREVSRHPALQSRLKPTEVGTMINAIHRLAISFDDLPTVAALPDPGDDFLLSLAMTSGSDFLVTGDKSGLLALGNFGITRIVTARSLVDLLKLPEA